MTLLFSPLPLRGVTLRNRIGVSPMCQYACKDDGLANHWHMTHLGSRAAGGAGLVVAEATAVSPDARISNADLGLWSTDHARALEPITEFIRSQGSVAGIQLSHAGRKGSVQVPWQGRGPLAIPQGGWEVLGPSARAFSPDSHIPRSMGEVDIDAVVHNFSHSATLARDAGFEFLELHLAHGYLAHQFLSPLTNDREDQWGGSFPNRSRLALDIAREVRRVWPAEFPLAVRLSMTDWLDGGWAEDDGVALAAAMGNLGVDLIVCSSGAAVPGSAWPNTPGVHVPFSKRVKRDAGQLAGVVGHITTAVQAERIISDAEADVVFLARAMLRDPYWAIHAAEALDAPAPWPRPYLRAASMAR